MQGLVSLLKIFDVMCSLEFVGFVSVWQYTFLFLLDYVIATNMIVLPFSIESFVRKKQKM